MVQKFSVQEDLTEACKKQKLGGTGAEKTNYEDEYVFEEDGLKEKHTQVTKKAE